MILFYNKNNSKHIKNTDCFMCFIIKGLHIGIFEFRRPPFFQIFPSNFEKIYVVIKKIFIEFKE